MKTQEFSLSKLIKKITSKLMDRDLTKVELIEIISVNFPGELNEKTLRKIYMSGIRHSYDSPNPFLTASIFYKNMSKCVPNSSDVLANVSARTFKNMILGMSKTKIRIDNCEDYKIVRQKFKCSFDIEPPSSLSILKAIMNDTKTMNKISQNPQFREKIESILFDLDPTELGKLEEKRLKTINNEIDDLKFEKMFIVDDNELTHINRKMERLEDHK